MLPIKKGRVSQEYGRPDAQYRKAYHSGIDLVADGDKNIYAAAPGEVIRSRYSVKADGADPNGWGNYVIVRQDDGKDVLYAHLNVTDVPKGSRIAAGDMVGLQGMTGNATGSHLHFEVWDGEWTLRRDINAAEYLGIKNQVGPVQLQDTGPYPDVPADHWAAQAVAGVTAAGIMGGLPDGTFHGDRPVTRYELASALDRLLQKIEE